MWSRLVSGNWKERPDEGIASRILSLVWLVSQHEGILLYLIIKSIKATSMLERLEAVGFGYTVGGARCVDIIVITSVQSADE